MERFVQGELNMKQDYYRSPLLKEVALSTDSVIAVSIGGSTENFPSEYPDGGLFEKLDDKGNIPW